MIRIQDVHDIQLRRARTNHETYKSLFEACCTRIRRRALLPQGPKALQYHVPAFVWGRPPFQHAHAVRYVSEKLRRNGFSVTECAPGALLVQWTSAQAQTSTPAKQVRQPAKPAKPAKPVKLSARLAALRKQLG